MGFHGILVGGLRAAELFHLRYDDFRILLQPVECDHFIETSRNASGGGSAIVSNDVDQ